MPQANIFSAFYTENAEKFIENMPSCPVGLTQANRQQLETIMEKGKETT